MSDRIIELRVENQRLKQQVESLEQKVLSLVGMTSIESSGGPERKNVLNDHLMSIIYSTQNQINIVSPLIDKFYATELKNLAKKGIAVLIITNDRGAIPKDYQEVYDDLKSTPGIKIINNPNVKYLLVFNSNEAIYSGGALDKESLEKSILIVSLIKERAQLRKIAEIFSLMLPSFMRTK
jgi:phosphatidylserine/phosphatidylglycerophosphate/cardiolipin synthase-like enzyme